MAHRELDNDARSTGGFKADIALSMGTMQKRSGGRPNTQSAYTLNFVPRTLSAKINPSHQT